VWRDLVQPCPPDRAGDRQGGDDLLIGPEHGSPGADDLDAGFLPVERHLPCRHGDQLALQQGGRGDGGTRVPGQAVVHYIVQHVAGREGQDRLAQRRTVQRHPAAYPGQVGNPVMAGDLVDVQDLQPVHDAQVHGRVSGLVQVLQERQRRLAQLGADRAQAGELEHAGAE
jgi:hypothetical protein